MRSLLLLSSLGFVLSACGHKHVMQEGHGEAFESVLAIQADRGRPTVADAAYPLTGMEGIELRLRVTEESTDEESGQAEAVQNFDVE